MYHLFLSDNSKQDSSATATHIKQIIELLKNSKCLGDSCSTILENKYGCAEHYRCDTSLYLFSILFQSFNIIIYRGISAKGHGREVVDGLNDTDKMFIFCLMKTFQLPGSERFDTKLSAHKTTQNTDVSLALEFQKHLLNSSRKHGI